MTQEKKNIQETRPDTKPANGLTLVVICNEIESKNCLQEIRSIWSIVANWGRWFDDNITKFPDISSAKQELPNWFVKDMDDEILEDWLVFIHDRDWMWWSGTVINSHLKIDISVGSMPLSLYPLKVVISKCNGYVEYEDKWMNLAQTKEFVSTQAN